MLNRRIDALWRGGFLIMVALAAVALAACRQSAGGVPLDQRADEATTGIRLEPTADSDSIIMGPLVWSVTLTDAEGQPVEDAVVSIRGDMHHAGMVPVEAVATYNGGGVYSADFEWTMAGDWVVTVTAEMTDGSTVSQTFDYTVRTQ